MQSGPAIEPETHVAVVSEVPGHAEGAASAEEPPSEAESAPASIVHAGWQIPSMPLVCLVRAGKVGDPMPKLSVIGSPASQTHPLGQALGLAPTTQVLEQKPVVAEPVMQKHAPAV